VHADHGVGRYLGLQTIKLGDIESELLTIEYSGGDKLYVPVSNLHLISRYSGVDLAHAPMNKLGTETWSRAKQKAVDKIRDVAAELLDLHARRAAKKGFVYPTRKLTVAREDPLVTLLWRLGHTIIKREFHSFIKFIICHFMIFKVLT